MMQLEPISMVFYNSEHLLTTLTGLVFILISYQFKIALYAMSKRNDKLWRKYVQKNFLKGYLMLTWDVIMRPLNHSGLFVFYHLCSKHFKYLNGLSSCSLMRVYLHLAHNNWLEMAFFFSCSQSSGNGETSEETNVVNPKRDSDDLNLGGSDEK